VTSPCKRCVWRWMYWLVEATRRGRYRYLVRGQGCSDFRDCDFAVVSVAPVSQVTSKVSLGASIVFFPRILNAFGISKSHKQAYLHHRFGSL
jgi:hypothetical protein